MVANIRYCSRQRMIQETPDIIDTNSLYILFKQYNIFYIMTTFRKYLL